MILKTLFIILSVEMDGSVAFGRCGRLIPAMSGCECAEMTFDELARRMRERSASFDAVQAETGAGLLCTACLPDLREHLAAEGLPMAENPGRSCVVAGALESDDPHEVGEDRPLAAAHDPR